MDNKNIPNLKELKTYNVKQLKKLCADIREILVDLASKKSVHFSSNLGIVELSTALLYVFDSPNDQILYDTGHQAYVHKILTDRYKDIYSIRDFNGLSGFQEPNESVHDLISTGHSGNIISIAQGLNEAKNSNNFYVPVVGDAAISNGLSFEALNSVSYRKTKMIIVINDNEMSISKNVGALHKMMSKFKTSGINFFGGNILRKLLGKYEWTKKLYFFNSAILNWIEQLFVKNNFFMSMNFKYIGPVDGHNIKKLIYAINKAKFHSQKKPVILHIKTKKGYGLKDAQFDKLGEFHASNSTNNDKQEISFGEIAANYISQKLTNDKNIYILNPAMTYSTGFLDIQNQYPNNYEDVGIAEEHCVTKAVGLTKQNKKVIAIIYSTFLQRTYDQLHHDISRLRLPITFLIDRADVAYGDGDTHHGIYDVAFLKTIPNTIITAPSNAFELKRLIELSLENKIDPFFIRYPKTKCIQLDNNLNFDFGDWILIQNNNSKNVIITFGPIINTIKEMYSKENVDIINAIFITKYDKDKVYQMLKKYNNIYVVEKIYHQNSLYFDLINMFYNDKKYHPNIISIAINKSEIGYGDKLNVDKKINFDIDYLKKKIVL